MKLPNIFRNKDSLNIIIKEDPYPSKVNLWNILRKAYKNSLKETEKQEESKENDGQEDLFMSENNQKPDEK